MPYDEALAARVRELVAEHGPAEEKSMFGGRAFLLGGHLAVCASHDGGLLVRVAEADVPDLLGEHVAPMEMGGRASRSWLRVDAADLGGERLDAWVARGVASATALPPKPGR